MKDTQKSAKRATASNEKFQGLADEERAAMNALTQGLKAEARRLGLVDRRFAPESTAAEPGGVITYWHVDDVSATFERLRSMGAREYQPITPAGTRGS